LVTTNALDVLGAFPAELARALGLLDLSSELNLEEEDVMVQKVIDIVGVSRESFAKAAENAVTEAAKTVHGMKWARVSEFEMELDDKKVTQYRATT
jgi:flavin-binding protein dodecin